MLIRVNFDPMQEVGHKVGYMQPLTFHSLFYVQVVCSELVPLEMRLIDESSGARQSGWHCQVELLGSQVALSALYETFLGHHHFGCVRFRFLTCMWPS